MTTTTRTINSTPHTWNGKPCTVTLAHRSLRVVVPGPEHCGNGVSVYILPAKYGKGWLNRSYDMLIAEGSSLAAS